MYEIIYTVEGRGAAGYDEYIVGDGGAPAIPGTRAPLLCSSIVAACQYLCTDEGQRAISGAVKVEIVQAEGY